MLALFASASVTEAATTIIGVASLGRLTNATNLTTHTFSGLTVTDGSTTVTYDLTVNGYFRFAETETPFVLTIVLTDPNASLSVSNVTDNSATEDFSFTGFTSIHAYHNNIEGAGTFDLTHAGGTITGITPPQGTNGDGTSDRTGIVTSFDVSSTLSLTLTSTPGSGNFVRFNEADVTFTGLAVPEPYLQHYWAARLLR